jgi:hypothetical protein
MEELYNRRQEGKINNDMAGSMLGLALIAILIYGIQNINRPKPNIIKPVIKQIIKPVTPKPKVTNQFREPQDLHWVMFDKIITQEPPIKPKPTRAIKPLITKPIIKPSLKPKIDRYVHLPINSNYTGRRIANITVKRYDNTNSNINIKDNYSYLSEYNNPQSFARSLELLKALLRHNKSNQGYINCCYYNEDQNVMIQYYDQSYIDSYLPPLYDIYKKTMLTLIVDLEQGSIAPFTLTTFVPPTNRTSCFDINSVKIRALITNATNTNMIADNNCRPANAFAQYIGVGNNFEHFYSSGPLSKVDFMNSTASQWIDLTKKNFRTDYPHESFHTIRQALMTTKSNSRLEEAVKYVFPLINDYLVYAMLDHQLSGTFEKVLDECMKTNITKPSLFINNNAVSCVKREMDNFKP